MKFSALSRRLAFIVLAIIAADQFSKHVMLAWVGIAARPAIEVLPFFKLVMVWNHGISFGMLSMPQTAMPYVLMAVAVVVSGVLWRLALRSEDAVERACYAVIIGGALGNALDRARFGAVADFFYFHIGRYGWPAFNIADAAIFCGVMLLLVRAFFFSKRT